MKFLFASILLLIAFASKADEFENASGIIGLYWLPCADDSVKQVDIYASPEDKEPIGNIYYAEQRRSPDGEPICNKPTVSTKGAGSTMRQGVLPLIGLKYGAGAIIVNNKNGWLEIKLDNGSGWVNSSNVKRYELVEELIRGDMSYFRTGDQLIQAIPGRSQGKQVSKTYGGVAYRPIRVEEFKKVDGELWVKVKSIPPPCDDDYEEYRKRKPFSGWVPFHDAYGQPTIWFFSGGC